jgi:hypothetical protein
MGATQSVAECDALVNAIVGLTRVGPEMRVGWSDITLLVGNHELGIQCVEELEQMGVHVAHVFSKDPKSRKRLKQAFWMGDARLKAATVHSFKGWESRAMVVHIGNAKGASALSTIYVALSRLRWSEDGSLLTVVCSAKELESYGQTWPSFENV